MTKRYRGPNKKTAQMTIPAVRLKPGECAVVVSSIPGNEVMAEEIVFGMTTKGPGKRRRGRISVLRKAGGSGTCKTTTPVRRVCMRQLLASL